jgi:hypothetical protein
MQQALRTIRRGASGWRPQRRRTNLMRAARHRDRPDRRRGALVVPRCRWRAKGRAMPMARRRRWSWACRSGRWSSASAPISGARTKSVRRRLLRRDLLGKLPALRRRDARARVKDSKPDAKSRWLFCVVFPLTIFFVFVADRHVEALATLPASTPRGRGDDDQFLFSGGASSSSSSFFSSSSSADGQFYEEGTRDSNHALKNVRCV